MPRNAMLLFWAAIFRSVASMSSDTLTVFPLVEDDPLVSSTDDNSALSTTVDNYSAGMANRVDPADLIDAQAVAEVLGLSQRSSVATYRKRYSDFPAPVVDMGAGRCLLWLRDDVKNWLRSR